MRNTFTLILFIFITTTVTAQIGFTKSKLIESHKDYKMDITDDGIEYITYTLEYENYNQFVACYLTDKKEGEEQMCYKALMIEPSSETNNWIKYFNNENYVKIDAMVWKDYEHSIVYKVSVKDSNCLVIKYFDREL